MLLRDLVERAGGGLELADGGLEAPLLLELLPLLHGHVGIHEKVAGIALRMGREAGKTETGEKEK